ncbi:MAG: hypothetical protein HY888_01135 [Deltaproteobacteria bacterium]|nr:hypothetical protein [Deltaproteobacteria bacterium]
MPAQNTGTTENLLGITSYFDPAIGIDVFRATGANGTVIGSTDMGNTWEMYKSTHPLGKSTLKSAASVPLTTNALYGGAFGNGTYVAVGSAGTILITPDGGATWPQKTSGTTKDLKAVAFGNNTFVAAGNSGTICFSTDNGLTWQVAVSNVTKDLYNITYGNSLFVAVGYSGTIITSPDGVTWTKRTSGLENDFYWTNELRGISFDSASGTFTAVGSAGTYLTSPDGITWTSKRKGTTNTLSDVIYANNTFVTVGAMGTVLTSPDGKSWSDRSIVTPGINLTLSGIAYGNSLFAAAGQSYNTSAYQATNVVYVSADGISWTQKTAPGTTALANIAFGNNTFVAGGANGIIVSSSDNGDTWSSRTSGIAGKITGITYGNGTFVAVSEVETQPTFNPFVPSLPGVPLTSSDGITWTKQSFGGSYNIYGVTFGNGLFVAVGSSGAILTSPDGITWTQQASGTGNLLVGATFGDNIFMVVGQNGSVFVSADGVTWSPRESGTSTYLYRAAWGNTKFVAVGYLGTIASSPDLVNGVCGVSNGLRLMTAPTADFCSAGTASALTGAGPWSWSCAGIGGGATANCSANFQKYGDCDNNGITDIAEVQSAINMFLGLKTAQACVDRDGTTGVSIAEVQKVINSFLGL